MFQINFKNKKAFSLLEIILAVAVFSGAAISVGYLIIDASKTTEINSKKIGTLFYAKEGIEAVRSIRNNDGFASLTGHVGNNGLSFEPDTNVWSFSGESDISSDGIYTRVVSIGDGANIYIKIATSTVTAESGGRVVSTSLVTQFTDWQVE